MTKPVSTFWTPERWALVCELFAERLLSTAAIARKIGDGCTKNMVIGRLHRHGMRRRVEPSVSTLFDRLPLTRISGCAFVYGDVRAGEWHRCGEATDAGSDWCSRHYSQIYIKRGERGITL